MSATPVAMKKSGPFKEGATFRPWGIDTLATIERVTDANITIVYDHEPAVKHIVSKRDAERIGRVVTRDHF